MINKEFKVNDFITLKLEWQEGDLFTEGRYDTVIYVANKRFRQCTFLLLQIHVDEVSSLRDIGSIDEAADSLDHSQERGDVFNPSIPPEVEFWGHCSNLQVWVENDYDTRLIHSNLAFPLLKRLTEVGDPKARKVFKDEIGKRLASGYRNTVIYLYKEGYLNILTKPELMTIVKEIPREQLKNLWKKDELNFLKHKDQIKIFLSDKEANAILNIEKIIKYELNMVLDKDKIDFLNDSYVYIENYSVIELNLFNAGIHEIPSSLMNLKKIKILELSNNKILTIPDLIAELKDLEEFIINDNKIRCLPDWIGNLEKLRWLGLAGNQIEDLPNSLLNLNNLEEFDFYTNDEEHLNEKSKIIYKKVLKKVQKRSLIFK